MPTDLEHMQEWIIRICAKLNDKDMLAAGDGNISVKLEADRVLITARGRNKSFLTKDDFAIVTRSGQVVSGEPSTELKMHLQVYETCPQARAVIHAHPPHLIGYSIANPFAKELPTDALPEVILGIGSIPIANYGRPGTTDLAAAVGEVLRYGHRALVMARHGGLAWGATLMEAYNGMERMEHAAKILAVAHSFGGPKPIDPAELGYLKTQFKARGMSSL